MNIPIPTEKQKVLVVTGTRPDAIKMAPIINALKNDDRYECEVASTGQHKEMLKNVLDWFNIQPQHTLDVMKAGQPLSHLAGKILSGMSDIIENVKPDIIMVHGDVTTSFVAALAGYYNFLPEQKKRVKIAHIEAGLRTQNLFSPFPEEGNRKFIAAIADYHFAPTQTAAFALKNEGVKENIFVTGNTVIDALIETRDRMKERGTCPLSFVKEGRKVILMTGHRRENYGSGFKAICHAIQRIAANHPEADVVYPVHLNPKVQKPVHDMLAHIPNVHLIPPMDYPSFVAAMMRAHIVLTDSGGLQEEAPALGKPVLVLRNTTERPEAVTAGTVKIVGTDIESIVRHTEILMTDEAAYNRMAQAASPYGDGKATQRILNLMAGGDENENTFHFRSQRTHKNTLNTQQQPTVEKPLYETTQPLSH